MTRLVPRLFSDVGDWFDAAGLPALTGFPSFVMRESLCRVEDYQDDHTYVIRAELPGLDPAKDVMVSVSRGILEITAERHEEKVDRRHSEFHYGMLHRTLRLPEGAKEDGITARYDKGILEIRVGLTEKHDDGKKIEIESTG